MRVSALQIMGLAAGLAMGTVGLLTPTRSEAAAFCQTIANTVNKADIDIDNKPGAQFACGTSSSTLDVVQFPGSGSASAEVTPGVLRTATRAMSSDGSGEGSSVSGRAIVDFRDTITVDGLGAAGALLTFSVGIEGLLSASGGGADNAAGDLVFTGGLANRNRLSGERRNFTACVNDTPPPARSCNGAFDVSGQNEVFVRGLVSLSVFALNGDVIDILLAQQTSSGASPARENDAASSEALFQHTTDWRGLSFTEYNRNVVLTSESGFDYRYAALPQAVPEPATWAMMILGFGVVGTALRGRRRRTLNA